MLGRAQKQTPGRLAAARRLARDRRDRPGHARTTSAACRRRCTRRFSRSWGSRARSTGISARSRSSSASSCPTSGPASTVPVDGTIGIHVYRVLQEALSNVVAPLGRRPRVGAPALRRRPRSSSKWRIMAPGSRRGPARRGLGLVAMRERAELVGGTIEFARPAEGGTLVRLRVPLEELDGQGGRSDSARPGRHTMDKITVLLADDHHLVRRGFRRMLEDDPRSQRRRRSERRRRGRAPGAQPRAARRRDGLRHARHERPRRDPAHPRDPARHRDPHAQHARRGDARVAGARRRRARIHPEERARPRPRVGGQARRRGRDGARSDA